MFRLRPALWPTLVSLPILVLSLGLGVWQMERREWKRDILDRIATNQAAAPMTLDELLRGDPLRHEYGRVKLAGTFLHDKRVPPRRAQPQEQGRPAASSRRSRPTTAKSSCSTAAGFPRRRRSPRSGPRASPPAVSS